MEPPRKVSQKISQEFDFNDLFPDGGDRLKSDSTGESSHNGDDEIGELNNSFEKDDAEEVEDVVDPKKSKVSLSDFTVFKLIGKGGYGSVYQVQKNDTKEIYAMKCLRKDSIIANQNVEYTKMERDVLRKVRHPFIVSLHYAFQNESNVYLVMDFINGGQILYHLREQAMFADPLAKFYVAEVILALEHLHSLGIIHRDLKPENILIDSTGHISLTDFGFAKELVGNNTTKTFCGTIEYMSPEMIKGEGYGKATDWWSVGILLFDMLTGEPPFRNKNESVLQKKITTDKLKLPDFLLKDTSSLIKGLLERNVSKRLGSGPTGVNEIKKHPYFKTINWKKLLNKEIDPPFRPNVPKGALDIGNFDTEFTNLKIGDSPVSAFNLSQSQEKLFFWVQLRQDPT